MLMQGVLPNRSCYCELHFNITGSRVLLKELRIHRRLRSAQGKTWQDAILSRAGKKAHESIRFWWQIGHNILCKQLSHLAGVPLLGRPTTRMPNTSLVSREVWEIKNLNPWAALPHFLQCPRVDIIVKRNGSRQQCRLPSLGYAQVAAIALYLPDWEK